LLHGVLLSGLDMVHQKVLGLDGNLDCTER
jgi:hypothetical protein